MVFSSGPAAADFGGALVPVAPASLSETFQVGLALPWTQVHPRDIADFCPDLQQNFAGTGQHDLNGGCGLQR